MNVLSPKGPFRGLKMAQLFLVSWGSIVGYLLLSLSIFNFFHRDHPFYLCYIVL